MGEITYRSDKCTDSGEKVAKESVEEAKLLEELEPARKCKTDGNTQFKEKHYKEAIKEYTMAIDLLEDYSDKYFFSDNTESVASTVDTTPNGNAASEKDEKMEVDSEEENPANKKQPVHGNDEVDAIKYRARKEHF